MRRLTCVLCLVVGLAAGVAVTLPLADRAIAQRDDAQQQARVALRIAQVNNLCIEAAADSADLWAATLHADKNVKRHRSE